MGEDILLSDIDRRTFLSLSVMGVTGLIIGCGSSPSSGGGAQQNVTLRFGAPTGADAEVTPMKTFGIELAKLSSGQFSVDLFPNEQIGDVQQMLQMVQLGSLSMTMATPSWMAAYAKQLDVLNLLFLGKSTARVLSGLDGAFGTELGKLMSAKGIKVLAWWPLGARNYLTNSRAIKTAADFSGLKLRTQGSPVWYAQVKALGANPIDVNTNEWYLSLQNHLIDGIENSYTELVSNKLYEVTKYLSVTEHVYDVFCVMIHQKLWDSFSSQQQDMITKAMATATAQQRKLVDTELSAALDVLKQHVQVIDSPDRDSMKAAVKPVYDSQRATLGNAIDDAQAAIG